MPNVEVPGPTQVSAEAGPDTVSILEDSALKSSNTEYRRPSHLSPH